jgi:hypothetical protein
VKQRLLALSLGAVTALAGRTATADDSLSGVCPDGSFFIVQSRSAIPCKNPHLADPSELPPVRPYLLPKPYAWYVDQEARNPNSPYNLVETGRKIREARAGVGQSAQAAPTQNAAPQEARAPQTASAPVARNAPAPAAAPLVSLADDELRDLVRLIGLRQEAAPASFDMEDAHGRKTLKIQLAYSGAFESYTLATLQRNPGANHVLVWSAQALRDTEFHPNFFVVQGGRTFRPDPASAAEVAYLLGTPGSLPSGEMAVGYLVVPANFDPSQPLEVFWNDRSVEATFTAPAPH